MIRFRFELRPVDEIVPWGDQDRTLHWFGLTDGWYWIELDGQELLHYSNDTLRRWRGEGHEAARPYVDYQVARLWEDLIQLAPAVLEPVPADLVRFVASHPARWMETGTGEAGNAAHWHGGHQLDLGYLSDPPWIQFWRMMSGDEDVLAVKWWHRPDCDVEFAVGRQGQLTMAAGSFIAAVEEFDRELLAAMERRIAGLERTGPPQGVRIDMHRLRIEQQDRAIWLRRALSRLPDTDWSCVRKGAGELFA